MQNQIMGVEFASGVGNKGPYPVPGHMSILPSLTGIRFAAAIHVVLFHYAAKTKGWSEVPSYIKTIVETGPVSVSLFFVLSGFILAFKYLGRHEGVGLMAGVFWYSRFARIYPVYLVSWLIYLPIAILKYNGWTILIAGVSSLTLIQAWLPGQWPILWNSPAWSLSVEAFFYVSFPLAAIVFHRLSLKNAITLTGTIWILSSVLFSKSAGLYFLPVAYIQCFLIGMTAAKIFLKGIRFSRAWSWLWLSVILLELYFRPLWEHLGFSILPPLFGLLVFSLAQQDQDLIHLILGSSILTVLGEASYSLYLLHGPLWNYAFPAYNWLTTGSMSNDCPDILLFLAFLVFSIAFSIACYRFVEIPSRKVLMSLITGITGR